LPTRESCSFRLSRQACTAGLLGNSRCDSVNSFISTEGGGEAKEQHKVRQLLSVPHWTTVERQCNSTSLSIASFQLGIGQLVQLAQTLSRRVDLTRQLCCSRPSESTEYSSVCINTDLGNTTLFFFGTLTAFMYRRPARVYIYIIVLCVCVRALYTSATVYMYTQNDRKTRARFRSKWPAQCKKSGGGLCAHLLFRRRRRRVCVCVFANSLRSQLFPWHAHSKDGGGLYVLDC
jgi:hypothetical protein